MKSRLLFALFFLSLGADLVLIGPHPDWRMLPAALVGWYVADMVSGLVHMYMDYRPCIPGTGVRELYFWEGSRDSPEFRALQAAVYARISTFERIVYDFKRHHPNPDQLGRNGNFQLMKEPVFLSTLPVSLLLNLVFLLVPTPGWLIVGVVVLILGASMTQVFHATLHRRDVGFCVRAMRRLGLLMSVSAHKLHHDTLRKDFSVISGWSKWTNNGTMTAQNGGGIVRVESSPVTEDRWRDDGDVQYRLLVYRRQGVNVILAGPTRADVRYVGALDRAWTPMHTENGSVLRALPRF